MRDWKQKLRKQSHYLSNKKNKIATNKPIKGCKIPILRNL